jgi:hypothetical protein
MVISPTSLISFSSEVSRVNSSEILSLLPDFYRRTIVGVDNPILLVLDKGLEKPDSRDGNFIYLKVISEARKNSSLMETSSI